MTLGPATADLYPHLSGLRGSGAALAYDGARPYIPWVWLNLDGGDNINDLPTC